MADTTQQAGSAQFPSNTQPATLAGPPNKVTFAFQNVQPPSALYIARDDGILLEATSNQANESVVLLARLLLPDGTINPIVESFPLGAARTFTLGSKQLAEGYLLDVLVNAKVATTRGQTFVRMTTHRGTPTGGPAGQVLFSDYCTTIHTPGYPGGRQLDPTEGTGWLHTVQISTPAAGSDWSVAVPANARWRVTAVNGTLTTAVAVANRQPQIQYTDGVNTYMTGIPSASIVASTTATVSGYPGATAAAVVTGDADVALPFQGILPSGHTIRSATVGLQAADQWSNIWLGIEEWLDSV